MRFGTHVLTVILSCCCFSLLQAQLTLLEQDFNDCGLPIGWEVNIQGNQNAVWYIGNAVQNNDDNGQSMNGSCFLFIDDDANGDNTPAYTLDVLSPVFDAAPYQTVTFSVDVHYRDYGPANESFSVFLLDDTTEVLLKRFAQGGSTGDTISDVVTLKYDLSFIVKSNKARLVFRYDDGGDFGWWAGIDNVKVVASGGGTNLVAEAFNSCAKPADWSTEIVSGDADWQFGINTNTKAANGSSMDGTCFAFFDDDILGSAAPYSTARLYSPWVDGTLFGRYFLDMDFILRYYSEIVTVFVQSEDGTEYQVAQSQNADVGGPLFNNPVHLLFEISQFRAKKMRIVFQYEDGNDYAWWTGVDNVKIVGLGAANDLCSNAKELQSGADCIAANNLTAILDGPSPACVDRLLAGLWYQWEADFTGTAQFTSQADFNEVVNVYTGDCTNPVEITCNNKDEHGFTSETSYFPAQTGTRYWIRVAGRDGSFGVPKGNLCVKIQPAGTLPILPANDACDQAVKLAIDGACITGSNRHAQTSGVIPSLNSLARADVWYQFVAPALSPAPNQAYTILSNATFSDIITVYRGGCANLTEIAGNHHGSKLDLPALVPGETYLIQIAGNFATVEGDLCAQIVKTTQTPPVNDNCLNALSAPIGGQCIAANNQDAQFSGYIPACVPTVARDVWFKFIATSAGAVRINTGADFEHVLAVWQGNCDTLQPVFCQKNPLRCDGFTLVGNLNAGDTYYIQVASLDGPSGVQTGDICLKILDGATQPEFEKMNLVVEEQCNSLTTAAMKVQIGGGMAPFSVEGVQNGQILNSGEVYLIVVTDALGCVQSLVGVVDNCATSGCTLATSATTNDLLCYGENNGGIQANVAGGTPPYTYTWSNGATTASLLNIPAGVYTATISDALGCVSYLADTLLSPTPIVAIATEITQPTIGESNGSIQLDLDGGAGVYGVFWRRNGVPYISDEDLVNAPAGNYTLQVTDANGCTALFNFELSEVVATTDPGSAIFAEIFPNPAKDKATLTIALPRPADVQLALADASGKMIQQWTVGNVSDQNIPLNTKDLPAGVYQLKIQVGTAQLARKLVVVK
jgi:hypothetical protein